MPSTHNDAGNLPEVHTGKARDTGKMRQFTTVFHIGHTHICLSENPDDTAALLNNRPVFPGMTSLSFFCHQNPYVPLEGNDAVMKLNGETIAMNGERKRSSLCQVHSQFSVYSPFLCLSLSLSVSVSLCFCPCLCLSLCVSLPHCSSLLLCVLNLTYLPNNYISLLTLDYYWCRK